MGLRRSPGGTHRGLHQTSQPRTRPELRSPRRHSTTKALNQTSRKKHGGFLVGSFGVWEFLVGSFGVWEFLVGYFGILGWGKYR